jgi:hypothetical protein
LFLIHREPFTGDLTIQIPIPHGSLLQAGPKRFGTLSCNVVPDGTVNEPAAIARFGQSCECADCGFRQNDVDPFVCGSHTHSIHMLHWIQTARFYGMILEWPTSTTHRCLMKT